MEYKDEENEGPVQGDYIISPSGNIGQYYEVGIYEGTMDDRNRWHRFNFSHACEWEDVVKAIKKDMDLTRYYPTVWNEDDHGGLTMAILGG